MEYRHEFETTIGDEVDPKDLAGATWKVVETYVDVGNDDPEWSPRVDWVGFTHRIELHRTDDQVFAAIEAETERREQEGEE